MSIWTLTLREEIDQRVDASAIRLADWVDQSISDVEQTHLILGRHSVPLADLFKVNHQTSDKQRLVIEGDLRRFDRIGHRHHCGRIHVAGSVGNHAGGSMSGGRLTIEGDAGDFLAAPHGAARQGMRGGRLTVGGSAGHHVGHRMRRGEVLIDGDVGSFTATQMFAGTIVVAGSIGDSLAIGMRRGTVVAASFPELPGVRFSKAVQIRSVFPKLIGVHDEGASPVASRLHRVRRLIDKLATEGFASRRGDRAVSGMGEVLVPREYALVD